MVIAKLRVELQLEVDPVTVGTVSTVSLLDLLCFGRFAWEVMYILASFSMFCVVTIVPHYVQLKVCLKLF